MNEYIKKHFMNSIRTKESVLENEEILSTIEDIAMLCVDAIKKEKKILICGNGGSASDAQHFAGEICGRFLLERRGYPCICLNTDTSVMTAIANDYGYEYIFSRQIEANAVSGDIFITISTSGNSKNCLNAMNKAREIGAVNIVLTGRDGGEMAKNADKKLIIPSDYTPHIQEAHITVIHTICYIIEKELSKYE